MSGIRGGWASLGLIALFGCADPAPVDGAASAACDDVAAYFAACGQAVPAAFGEQCARAGDGEREALLASECDELPLLSAGVEGKADGRAAGAGCVFTASCDHGLVCRPDMSFVNTCQPPGGLGEHCWLSSHCAEGLSCHWIWHEIEPASHPGRVCDPHDDDREHPHQPKDLVECPPAGAFRRAPPSTAPITLDPAGSYEDRLRLLDVLREAHPYPFDGSPSAWPDHRGGIHVQTRWQLESGRATTDAAGRLWGWWPNVNWGLTAWPLEALQLRGELTHVRIAGAGDARFRLPPAVVDAVHEYADAIDAVRARAEAGTLPCAEVPDEKARLQALMRKLHTVSLDAALPRNEDARALLPDGERVFSSNWGYSLVRLLAAANFPTDEATVSRIQELVLPSRFVDAADYDPSSASDLSAAERGGLVAMRAFHELEQRTGWLLHRTVQAASRLPGAAGAAASLIEQALRRGAGAADFLLHQLRDLVALRGAHRD